MEIDKKEYLYDASREELEAIRTQPGTTSDGKPFDWYVQDMVGHGRLRLECVRADVLGLKRPLEIYRAVRKTNLIKPWPALDDTGTYCPAHWADLAIGCGPCGFRCRACFLNLTHRIKCDPSRHVVYEYRQQRFAPVRGGDGTCAAAGSALRLTENQPQWLQAHPSHQEHERALP